MPLDHTNLPEFHLKYFSEKWVNAFIAKGSLRGEFSVWRIEKGGKWEEKDVNNEVFRLQRGFYFSKSLNDMITRLEGRITSDIVKQPFFFSDTNIYSMSPKNKDKRLKVLLSFLLLSILRGEDNKRKHGEFVAESIRRKGYTIDPLQTGHDYEDVVELFLFNSELGLNILSKRLKWGFLTVRKPHLFITGDHPWFGIENPNPKMNNTLEYTFEDRLNDIREVYFPISRNCCFIGFLNSLAAPTFKNGNDIKDINIMLAITCEKYLVSSQKGFAGDELLYKTNLGNHNVWYQNQDIVQWKPI